MFECFNKFKDKNNTRLENIQDKGNVFVVTTDYMKVIEASVIAEMETPIFNQSERKDELDYKVYLENVQPLIEAYEQSESISALKYKVWADKELNQERQNILDNFMATFMKSGDCISVEKMLSGKYRVASNGCHRMYVAKKYGLKLLVHVIQEVRKISD